MIRVESIEGSRRRLDQAVLLEIKVLAAVAELQARARDWDAALSTAERLPDSWSRHALESIAEVQTELDHLLRKRKVGVSREYLESVVSHREYRLWGGHKSG